INVLSRKKADCPSCSTKATYPFLSFDVLTKNAVLCGRESVQIRPSKNEQPNIEQLAMQLKSTEGDIEVDQLLLSTTLDAERMVIFKDGRALIHGTNDVKKANTLYHRYFS